MPTPADDLDPRTALVLLWYWEQCLDAPDWVFDHPAWPANYPNWDPMADRLREAARQLIEAMEREVRP
jgi:hypothetical protein